MLLALGASLALMSVLATIGLGAQAAVMLGLLAVAAYAICCQRGTSVSSASPSLSDRKRRTCTMP